MQLEIRDLSKTYANGTQALKNVSLTIPTGMFGLLGPNGAGKSTLMRTIAGLQEADAGTIDLDGVDVLEDKQAVRRVLGYLPQEFGVYPEVEAEEMLLHIASLKGIANATQRKQIVGALLAQTNLAFARRTRLGEFSGGMKQRFGIAQALIGDPRLIIVDEPTAGLDPEERRRFLNLLSEIGEHVVVILSTHIVDDVAELCSRMAIIHQGEVLLAADPVQAVARLRGLVWQRTIAKADLAQFSQAHRVISMSMSAGRLVVHVYSEAQPDPSFEAVEPVLEDVYFATVKLGGNSNGNQIGR
jgi:ABC-2 type transport system ATP-binding protein